MGGREPADRGMQVVVTVATLCNLRDHARSVDARDGVRTWVDVTWHGAEPLALPVEFYRRTPTDQRDVFGPGAATTNRVQTDPVPRDGERRALLADGFDSLVLADTDGSGFTHGGPRGDPAWSIGNTATEAFAGMLSGPVFGSCAAAAERRVARNCLPCPLLDVCGGWEVTETVSRVRDDDGHGTVLRTARPVIAYVVERLRNHVPAGSTR